MGVDHVGRLLSGKRAEEPRRWAGEGGRGVLFVRCIAICLDQDYSCVLRAQVHSGREHFLQRNKKVLL